MNSNQAVRAMLGEDRGSAVNFVRAAAKQAPVVAGGRMAARLRGRSLDRPPVLLVGCPRSGTTLLFDLLRPHPSLRSDSHEGHVYWSGYNHPRRHGWRSDALDRRDLRPHERRYVEHLMATRVGDAHGAARLLDKTPKNALRLPYLRALFPDAAVVLVVRDGPSTVASLLEGWQQRHGASYLLPERLRLRDYDSRLWRYVLPPGWRDLQGTDLPAVATRQYVACTEAVHRDRDLVDEVVRYEDLVGDPVGELRRLLAALDLAPSEEVEAAGGRLSSATRSSWSAPRPDKWLAVRDRLDPHLPAINAAAALWGYDPA